MQGGPLEHVIAGKAVAFGEALQPSYKTYCQQVIKNAQAMAGAFVERGYDLISGGTDNHLMLIDLSNKGVTGKRRASPRSSTHYRQQEYGALRLALALRDIGHARRHPRGHHPWPR